jgi:hypothetical protein
MLNAHLLIALYSTHSTQKSHYTVHKQFAFPVYTCIEICCVLNLTVSSLLNLT